MIITISGQVGSGKSTLAGNIAARFNLQHISAGGIMRRMAEEHNMSLLEFSRFAELNSWIDKEIDQQQKEQAKSGDCVVEGRISAHFLKADLKVFLITPLEIRARRVMKRDDIASVGNAIKAIEEREGSEKKRYQKIYGIDLDDLEGYDLILNTAKFTPEEMGEIVAAAIERVFKP